MNQSEMIDFFNITPTIINGSIRRIDKTIQGLSVSLKDISAEMDKESRARDDDMEL